MQLIRPNHPRDFPLERFSDAKQRSASLKPPARRPRNQHRSGPLWTAQRMAAFAQKAYSKCLFNPKQGVIYPAQQDSLATSFSKVCAASFRPSTVVR
jgi:hypothetical protein